MASTNQINKVVELIAVLGDLIILNFSLSCSFSFGKKRLYICLFLVYFFDDDLSKSLLFGMFVSRGKAWNSREIRADQLVLRVLKNIVMFSFFGHVSWLLAESLSFLLYFLSSIFLFSLSF